MGIRGIVLAILMVLFCSTAGLAAQVTLAWDANTEPDLVGYRIYKSLIPGQYVTLNKGTTTDTTANLAATVLKPTTTVTVTVEDNETWYFVATAFNATEESAKSNEVTPKPKEPQTLREQH